MLVDAFSDVRRMLLYDSFPGDMAGERRTHLAHLADTAGLAQRADCPHVALVPGAKFGGVVIG